MRREAGLMRCEICGDRVTGTNLRFWRKPHYPDLHPQYSAWSGRWFRNFFIVAIAFVFVLVLSDFLWLTYGGPYGYAAGIANLLFVVFALYDWSWVKRRNVRRLIRQWEDAHKPV